jgi:hypothetical protein
MIHNSKKGAILSIVLAFAFIFIIMLGGFFTFILIQHEKTVKKVASEEAFQIAEAGVDYYKWCLNHGIEADCEDQKDYYDSEGNLLGTFFLDISSEISCGETISTNIYSTGWSKDHPLTKRKIGVLYGRASVAKYAYLLNNDVWAGSDREVRGLYHSNGGIRMDGENESLVSSSLPEWVCTSSFGCDSCPVGDGCRVEDSTCICPGVFSTADKSNPSLFDFPITSFDFDGITFDLSEIKSYAQNSSIYLPPSTDIDASADGYHLIFNNDGTVEVRIITQLFSDWAYSEEEGWHYDYFRIRTEYFYNTYNVSSSCPVIFIEDDLWVEGIVNGKVTVASADLISPTKETDVILAGDIVLSGGSDAIAVIGENNLLIPPDSPDSMELKGVFIAQNGRFGRNHYDGNIKSKLEIIGSVVSNKRVGTQWTSGSFVVSGYLVRENYVDPNLIYFPPPFVPYAEHNFSIIKWEEVE